MVVPACSEHAKSISLIQAFMATNDATKEYYNDDIKVYFDEL